MTKSPEILDASKTPQFPDAGSRDLRRVLAFAAAILAGIVFRLIWPADMEYKGDETWTFTHVVAFFQTQQFPRIGMISSTGLPNAGMSLWVFLGLGALFGHDNPLELARGVQWLSIAALLLLGGFIRFGMPREAREPWFWAVALLAVSPMQVLFERKIWAQSTLPLFSTLTLIGWWYRSRWWGALLWGLVGTLLGQIHMSGFFFEAALAVGTLLFDRRSVCWPAWVLGSCLGALPMLPWLGVLADGGTMGSGASLFNLLPNFPLQWLGIGIGIGIDYSVGRDLFPFLMSPRLGFVPLCLVGIAEWGIALLLVMIAHRFTARWLRLSRNSEPGRLRNLLCRLGLITATGVAPAPDLLLLNAGSWMFALPLMATLRPICLFYLLVLFPLPYLWLARVTLAGGEDRDHSRRLLAAMVALQAILTLLFLCFVHQTKFIDGDYGTVYHAQTGHAQTGHAHTTPPV